jgi:hypothetical protein
VLYGFFFKKKRTQKKGHKWWLKYLQYSNCEQSIVNVKKKRQYMDSNNLHINFFFKNQLMWVDPKYGYPVIILDCVTCMLSLEKIHEVVLAEQI